MNNSNMEFTMDDASYQTALKAYSNGQGGYTLKGLQPELPTIANQQTFSSAMLQGDAARLHSEFGEQNYHILANQYNAKIRTQNEAIIAKDRALRATASPEEIEALQYITEENGYKDKIIDELIKGNPAIKSQLKNLQQVKADQRRRGERGEVVLNNGYDLDKLENMIAMANKRASNVATPEDKMAWAQAISQTTGNNVQYDINTNGFFVIDNIGNRHDIKPSILDDISVWGMDALGSLAAYKWLAPTMIRGAGRIAGGVGTAGAPVTGGVSLAIGAAIFVGTEFLASALSTALDGMTEGELSENFFTAPHRIMGWLGDDDSTKYVQDFSKVMDVVGYPDAEYNVVQEGVLGAGTAVAFKAVGKGYHYAKTAKQQAGNLYSRVRTTVGDNPLQKSVGEKVSERAELAIKGYDAVSAEIAIKELRAAMKTDTELSAAQAVAKARNIMKNDGITEVGGKSVDDLTDTEVAYFMLQSNEVASTNLAKTFNMYYSASERTAVRKGITDTADSINNQIVKMAEDGLDNATASNWITRLKEYETAVEQKVKRTIEVFGGSIKEKFTIDGNLFKNLHHIYNYQPVKGGSGKIDKFFGGNKKSADTLGETSIKANLNNSKNPVAPIEFDASTGLSKVGAAPTGFEATAKDLLNIRFELMARGDEIAANIEGGITMVRQMIKDIDTILTKDKTRLAGSYDKLIEKFETSIKDVHRARNANNKFKTGSMNVDKITSKEIGNFAEQILLNADNSLPNIQQFAKILAHNKIGEIPKIAAQLEHNVVNQLINKNLANGKIDAKKTLEWLAKNKNSFTTQEGRIMAEMAEGSVKLMSDLQTMVTKISTAAVPRSPIGAAMSPSAIHSLLVYFNRSFLGRMCRVGGFIVKTDMAQQRQLAKRFADFIANPVDIKSVEGLKHNIASAVAKGHLTDDAAADLARSMGEMSGLYNDIKTNPNKILEMAEQIRQAEAAAAAQ